MAEQHTPLNLLPHGYYSMNWNYLIKGTQSKTAPTGEQMLATFKNEHPRLIIDTNLSDRVQNILNTDPQAPRWYEHLKSEAKTILDQALSHYEIPDGRRLLSVSRQVKERVRILRLPKTANPVSAVIDHRVC